MADWEKVIKGLECCSHMTGEMCKKCPYADECEGLVVGTAHLAADALSLLKTQEPQYVYNCAEMIDDIVVGKCPSCDRTIVNKVIDPTRFCKYCGQAVKWE